MLEVEIYYARVCGLCTKALDFLRSRGVTYAAYAVEWDSDKEEFTQSENTSSMYKRCGEKVEFVPQIFIGDRHIRGWKTLEPMIQSGEINDLLPESGE